MYCFCHVTKTMRFYWLILKVILKESCINPALNFKPAFLNMSGDCHNFQPIWSSAPPNEAITPVQWLIGKWQSISAEGTYPTINPFTYCEEISFVSFGQPLLNYSAVSWHPVKQCPMHLESGFLRIHPGTKNLAFMVSHNFGLTTLEEGTLITDRTIKLSSKGILRMSFAKDPEVTSIERTYELVNDKLEMTLNMQTNCTSISPHLKVVYKKI